MHRMEFPEDIRLIIYEFSRPYFKQFREYKRALRVHNLTSWPSLKNALMTNPDKVLHALLDYQLKELSFRCMRHVYLETWHSDDTAETQYLDKEEKFKESKENLYKLLEN
jgi:hypothetical protein